MSAKKMLYIFRFQQVLFLISMICLVTLLNGAVMAPKAQENSPAKQESKDSSGSMPQEDQASSKLDMEAPLVPPQMEMRLRTPEESKLKRVVTNRAFGPGERLEFSVGYGMIKAGTAVMEIPDMVKEEGRKCYHLVSTAQSNKFFSVFLDCHIAFF